MCVNERWSFFFFWEKADHVGTRGINGVFFNGLRWRTSQEDTGVLTSLVLFVVQPVRCKTLVVTIHTIV